VVGALRLKDQNFFDDMVQEGARALVIAANLYNPKKFKTRFSTYAVRWIKSIVYREYRYQQRLVHIPEHIWFNEPDRRLPTMEHMSEDQTSQLPDRQVPDPILQMDVQSALHTLPLKLQAVIRALYTDPIRLNKTEIGRALGCSRNWVAILEKRALALLATESPLKEYEEWTRSAGSLESSCPATP
jgi:RNA polymerase sigma factor (sigma-70 family)